MNPTNGNDKETNGGHSQNAPGNGNAEQVSRNPQQQPNLLNAAELNSLGGNNLSALLSQQQHGQNQNAAGLNILGNNILGLLPQQQQQQPAHNGNAFSFLQQQQQAQQLSQLQAIINSGSNYGSSNNLLPQQVPNQTMLMMLQLGLGQQPPAINANNQLAMQLANLQQQQQANGLDQFNMLQSLAGAPNGTAMAQALAAAQQPMNQLQVLGAAQQPMNPLLLGLGGNLNLGLGGLVPNMNTFPNQVLAAAMTSSANAAVNPSQDAASRILINRAAQGGGKLDDDPVWDEHFKALQRFRLVNGHTKVPARYKDNPKLGRWVMTQRRQMALSQQGFPNTLNSNRIAMLDAIGFSWNVRPEPVSTWEQKLEELNEYKVRHFVHLCLRT